MLPPAVTVEVQEIGHNHATFRWSYTRPAFISVTSNYTLTVRSTGDEKTFTVNSETTQYDVSNLIPETKYTVFVTAGTRYGFRTSGQVTATTIGKQGKNKLD